MSTRLGAEISVPSARACGRDTIATSTKISRSHMREETWKDEMGAFNLPQLVFQTVRKFTNRTSGQKQQIMAPRSLAARVQRQPPLQSSMMFTLTKAD